MGAKYHDAAARRVTPTT